MANVTTHSVFRHIGSLYGSGTVIGLSDRQLLERFISHRNSAGEDAFAALVARHGPMVLRVCNQLLGDQHHSEDAFQAVFLVLASRARSIRDPDLLGNWLYGIALRTARKARNRLARQQRTEEDRALNHAESCTTITAEQVAIAHEHAETLHAEIERLPGVFRVPVVLCYFEGLTLDQVALRLRCPAGTIHSRLVRARDKLRARPHPPRHHHAGRRTHHGFVTRLRIGFGFIAPVRNNRACRDFLRRRPVRRAAGRSPCPGGASIDDVAQIQTRLADAVLPRRGGHEHRLSDARSRAK